MIKYKLRKIKIGFLLSALAFVTFAIWGCGSSTSVVSGDSGDGASVSSITLKGTLQTGTINSRSIKTFAAADGWTVITVPDTASASFDAIYTDVSSDGSFAIPISDTTKTYVSLLLNNEGKIVCPIDFNPSTEAAKIGLDSSTINSTSETTLGTVVVDTTNKLAVLNTTSTPAYASNELTPDVDANGAVVGAADKGYVKGGSGAIYNNSDKDNDGIPNAFDRDADGDGILRPFDADESKRNAIDSAGNVYSAQVFYNYKLDINLTKNKDQQWITIMFNTGNTTGESPTIESATLVNFNDFSYLADAAIRGETTPFDGSINGNNVVIDNIDIGAPDAGEVWRFNLVSSASTDPVTVEAQMDVVFTLPPQITAFKFNEADGWIDADTSQKMQGTLSSPTFEVRWQRPTPEDSFDITNIKYTIEISPDHLIDSTSQEVTIMDFGEDDGSTTTLEATVDLTGYLADGNYNNVQLGLCARSYNNDNIATNFEVNKNY